MGMLTNGRIEIAAPAVEVWAWLIDPVKLTTWLGGPGGMPEDPAELHVGWSTTNDSPAGEVRVEITEFEPPSRLAYRSTYTGGDQVSTYRLTEGDGVTTVQLDGDTDWGRPEGGLPEAFEEQVVDGAYDSLAQPQLQDAVETTLTKLKSLVEAEAQNAKN